MSTEDPLGRQAYSASRGAVDSGAGAQSGFSAHVNVF
eukprot:CAMPEP_0173095638 /NCGR_PEP_ID=MMETSP1102-20130122/32137_1 /TAXON_ID=49646 /ORGANISM="Geminigera sp., Strain Caron Lab Isolate" /LENGTH=36 /DNA_ID= /DNA_START= /DNA_END= /DNA_ORIENTATION=